MKHEEDTKKFADVVEAICNNLNLIEHRDVWKLDDDNSENCISISGDDGYSICFDYRYPYAYKGKIRIHGDYPMPRSRANYRLPKDAPDITVSLDREPDAIAKDVMRRFIPAYKLAFVEAKEAAEKWNHYEDSRADVIKEFAELIGDKHITDYQKTIGEFYNGRLKVKIGSNDSVTITIDYAPVEIARTLIKTIMEACPSITKYFEEK